MTALPPGSYEIVARHSVAPTEIVLPDQFLLAPGRAATRGSPFAAMPGALWWCDVPMAELMQGMPFPYAHQRTHARRISVVPHRPAPPAPVRILASIGRCGSTLAAQLARAAGAPVLGELDVFTHLGGAARRAPGEIALRAELATLAANALAPLPSGAVVKVRSQATPALEALAAATTLRPLFLVRDFAGWSASMRHHFPAERPETLLSDLADGLKAAAAARAQVLHYDDLRYRPERLTEALGLAASDPRPVLAYDSQAGTPLARRAAPPPVDLSEAWAARAPRAALVALGLGRDLRPLGDTQLRPNLSGEDLSGEPIVPSCVGLPSNQERAP
ncbi:MAG: hypothetical protein ACU0CO_06870 [Shimia sp.]